jgi:hypothetical protein
MHQQNRPAVRDIIAAHSNNNKFYSIEIYMFGGNHMISSLVRERRPHKNTNKPRAGMNAYSLSLFLPTIIIITVICKG